MIATTRPETMFGDVALMVHPEDERYQKYIGRKVYIPEQNEQSRLLLTNMLTENSEPVLLK